MDLSLHLCQVCSIAISNRVENRNWLVLVSLTRWHTNRKIISVSNRLVSWCPMSQGAPVSPTHTIAHVQRTKTWTILVCALWFAWCASEFVDDFTRTRDERYSFIMFIVGANLWAHPLHVEKCVKVDVRRTSDQHQSNQVRAHTCI